MDLETKTVIKPYKNFIDDSFSLQKSEHYILYLQLSLEGLKYTILDPTTKKFLATTIYLFEEKDNIDLAKSLHKVISADAVFSAVFKKVQVTYINEKFTLIPKAVFLEDQIEKYHQFSFLKEQGDKTFYDSLPLAQANNVFSIPNAITDVFSKMKNVYFHHFSSTLIEKALAEAKNKKEAKPTVYVHVLETTLQIVVVENQSLKFCNNFSYQTPEDFLYYLIFTLQQIKIEINTTPVLLSGNIHLSSDSYKLLEQYVALLRMDTQKNPMAFSANIPYDAQQEDILLYHQFLCE